MRLPPRPGVRVCADLFGGVRCGRLRGLQPDEAVFKQHVAALEEKLDAYEVLLARQKYIGGDVRLFPLPVTRS